MSWQFVFNTRFLLAGSDRMSAAKRAYEAGYRFMTFNGEILFLMKIEDKLKTVQTPIKTEDLY